MPSARPLLVCTATFRGLLRSFSPKELKSQRVAWQTYDQCRGPCGGPASPATAFFGEDAFHGRGYDAALPQWETTKAG